MGQRVLVFLARVVFPLAQLTPVIGIALQSGTLCRRETPNRAGVVYEIHNEETQDEQEDRQRHPLLA